MAIDEHRVLLGDVSWEAYVKLGDVLGHRREEKERGLEPDECYCVGDAKPMPDLAIEVVHSSSAMKKLPVYLGLGVGEVWIFEGGRFTVHALVDGGARYEARAASALFPAMDFDELARFAAMPDQDEAVRAYWASLA